MSTPVNASDATYQALERVRTAWYSGRPIVPIIGAGFSADSGFPILNSICRYLARFKYALDHNLLMPGLGAANVAPALQRVLRDVAKEAKTRPIRYIERFGWPDRFDLAQKVARHVCTPPPTDKIPQEPRPPEDNKTAHERIEKAIDDKFDWLAEMSASKRAASHWNGNIRERLGSDSRAWHRWASQGDWRRLIQFFTDYRADYGDDLFAQFGFRRSPGAGHRYLTLLVKLLSIRTIFTFNFDDLIEKALALEGISYRLFGMEHGSSLPSPRLVGDDLSVIKMHGSHHSLLIDEVLDRPLGLAYVQRFSELAGPDALILVLGCSGDDRRLGDILEHHIDPERRSKAEICWLHFEPTSPVPADVVRTGQERVLACPTNGPAAFVRHVLFDLTGRFPESSHPYPSHPAAPVPFGKPERPVPNKLLGPTGGATSYRCEFDIEKSEDLLVLGAFCANNGFITIWVDLEAVHTLAGLVGAIIDGCRRVDTELPPAVMPIGDFKQSETDALDRLVHALQRQRYAVLIDGLNAYGASPIMHHSPKASNLAQAKEDVAALRQFLEALRDRQIGQSIVIASKTDLNRRRDFDKKQDFILPPSPDADGPPLLWACLSAVRRTRPLPALRRLLGPLVPGAPHDERNVDAFLRREAAKPRAQVRILEGGDLWFARDERDARYNRATQFTSKEVFRWLAEEKRLNVIAWRECALAQSLLMSLLHQKIASTYFTFEFMQSGDAAAFMEYTYHRISSVRYLSRLIHLLHRYPTAWAKARERFVAEVLTPVKEVNEGFDAGQYFHSLWGAVAPTRPESELMRANVPDIAELRRQRVGELEALLASWEEWEQAVRSQVPAEQLILWIGDIIDGDFRNRLSGVYEGTELEVDDCLFVKAVCQRLEQYFKRLLGRIHLERGDFKEAPKWLSTSDPPDPETILDQIECVLRSGDLAAAERLLHNLPSDSNVSSEFVHRKRHLEALLALGGPSQFEGSRIWGTAPRPDHAKALESAEEGIKGIRGTGWMRVPALRGMVVASGAIGSGYRSYRSVFRTLKGRALVAKLLASEKKNGTSHTDLTAFRAAMRQFDQAKGGLGAQQVLLRGWAELHAAESTLLLVRRLFERDTEPDILGTIEAKLRNCRTHLQSGLGALRTGRRNALWWRHCFQLITQYHTERLFVDLCRLDEAHAQPAGERDRRAAYGLDLLRRYVRALEALASFADYSLQREEAFGTAWVKRTLAEVHLVAAVAVAHYEASVAESPTLQEITDLFSAQLREQYPSDYAKHGEVCMAEAVSRAAAQVAAPGMLLAPHVRRNQLGAPTLLALVEAIENYSRNEHPRALPSEGLSDWLRSCCAAFVESNGQDDSPLRWRSAVVAAVLRAGSGTASAVPTAAPPVPPA